MHLKTYTKLVSPTLRVVGLERPELKPVELVFSDVKQEAPTSISEGSSPNLNLK